MSRPIAIHSRQLRRFRRSAGFARRKECFAPRLERPINKMALRTITPDGACGGLCIWAGEKTTLLWMAIKRIAFMAMVGFSSSRTAFGLRPRARRTPTAIILALAAGESQRRKASPAGSGITGRPSPASSRLPLVHNRRTAVCPSTSFAVIRPQMNIDRIEDRWQSHNEVAYTTADGKRLSGP